jgi:nitrate reductase gamma subunit
MSDVELLNWARGTGMDLAIGIFVVGMIVRVLGIVLLGRKTDLSEARQSGVGPGLRTIVSRSWPDPGTFKRTSLVVVAGYVFHVGFLVTLLFYAPHILLLSGIIGFGWPALPTSLIDVLSILSIAALIALLVNRITDPVRRQLSGFGDYFTWLVTLLPLLTGYLALNRMLLPYTEMLAWHIISVQLLLVCIPFTKLAHAVTFIFSRYYNGAIAGRKGVRA